MHDYSILKKIWTILKLMWFIIFTKIKETTYADDTMINEDTKVILHLSIGKSAFTAKYEVGIVNGKFINVYPTY